MTSDDSFQTLKNFFETRRAASQAMKAINEGVEIQIVIGDVVECALFRRGDTPVVEQRTAVNPDVVFHIRPESVTILNEKTKDEIGDIGVGILKEILTGNIRVKVPGRFWNLINRGYLDLIRQGGTPVMTFLAQHGLASVSKITAAIKQMKS